MTEPLHYRPSSSAVYYTPPRQINPGKTLVGMLISMAGAIVGAVAYAKLQPEMSSPYLRVGAVFAASVATGILAMFVVRFGRVRLPAVAAFIGAILGLLAIYVMWVVWVTDVMRASGVIVPWTLLVKRPKLFYLLIADINRTGTWAYSGAVARGGSLLMFWLVEASAILAGAVLMAIKSMADQDAPVCRQCGSTCRSIGRLPRFDAARESEIIAAVESRNFAKLAEFPSPAHEDDPEITLRLVSCPACKQTHVFTVSKVAWHVLPSTRAVQVKSVPIVNQMLVTLPEAKQIEMLQALLRDEEEEASDASQDADEKPDSPV